MNQYISDVFQIGVGAGAASSGIGIGFKLFVSASKTFIKEVLPLFKQKSVGAEVHQCKYHESMAEVVDEFKKSSDILIRIEVRLEERLKDQAEMNKNIIELFDRLRLTETKIAVLESGKVKI